MRETKHAIFTEIQIFGIFSHLTKIPPSPQKIIKRSFLRYVGCTQKNRLNESSPTLMKLGYLDLTNMYTCVVQEYHARVEGIHCKSGCFESKHVRKHLLVTLWKHVLVFWQNTVVLIWNTCVLTKNVCNVFCLKTLTRVLDPVTLWKYKNTFSH